MINSSDFAKRLEKVMEYYGESASSFADKIGVQRSSISHILSGRNKPSLDFVMKVLTTYPEVELHWLLNGKGQFTDQTKQQELPDSNLERTASNEKSSKTELNSDIEKIVIFYSDGTFKSYRP